MNSLAEGSVVAGRYRLERMLARGGMGSIWAARHLQLDAAVAVKLMAPEYAASSTARARFEREARAAAQLKIPNVVHVHDYGIEDDTPFLVMELLDGEDLEARLSREGRLSRAATLSIVTQVCKALRRAHEMGIVHRDLKPANLFLSRQDEDELVKVLDFGIAKAQGTLLAGQETKTGTLVGSPYYMSPEQVRRSKTLDWRSDLWSVGVIAFRCLTGGLPFPGEEIGEVFVAICTEDIPLASSLVPELGPEMDGFFSRALARDPAHRFQSASELAEAFGAAVGAAGSGTRALQPSVPAEGASPLLAVGGAAPAASPDAMGARPDAFSPTLRREAGALAGRSPSGGASESGTSAFQGHVSTLTPAGTTLAPPQGRGRRVWISLAFGASALALGLVTHAVLRTPAPGDEPTSRPDPAASPAAAPALSAPAPSATATEPLPPPAHSATAAPGAPAASDAPTSAPAPVRAPPAPSPSARKGAPQPPRPRIPRDDPTEHM